MILKKASMRTLSMLGIKWRKLSRVSSSSSIVNGMLCAPSFLILFIFWVEAVGDPFVCSFLPFECFAGSETCFFCFLFSSFSRCSFLCCLLTAILVCLCQLFLVQKFFSRHATQFAYNWVFFVMLQLCLAEFNLVFLS